MRDVAVFDVNETLLDLSALQPFFRRLFADERILQTWFLQVLQFSLVSTLAGPYQQFGTIATAVLEMVAEEKKVSLSEADRMELSERMQSLPPHPDVIEGLSRLRSNGVRMATLTNSAPASMKKQLEHAGLTQFFEQTISVDAVRLYKPAPQTYHEAARILGIGPQNVVLVAAHAWDVAGAMQAGCKTAFVARAGRMPCPLYPRPTLIGRDIIEIADQLLSQAV